MKNLFAVVLIGCAFALGLAGCGLSTPVVSPRQPDSESAPQSVPETAESSSVADSVSEPEASSELEEEPMKIRVTAGDTVIVYELNDSQAARELYAQLSLTLEVENFSTNEKVFYPPEKLNTEDTPVADAGKGTLAYYSPWADVVMFYDRFEPSGSLYELGHVVSGEDRIETLSGTIEVAPDGRWTDETE